MDGVLHIPHSDKRLAGFKKDKKQLGAEIHRKYSYEGHVADYMKIMLHCQLSAVEEHEMCVKHEDKFRAGVRWPLQVHPCKYCRVVCAFHRLEDNLEGYNYPMHDSCEMQVFGQ